jgi:hypothetical protein
MKVIHDKVSDAYIQTDLFWQFHDVVKDNKQLATSQNVFLYWVNALFTESIVMAVRRQIDRHPNCISLRRLLDQLHAQVDIAGGHVTQRDIQTDIASLEQQSRIIQGYADRRVAHTDPQHLQDGTPTFRDVQNCIEQLCGFVNKYAAAIGDNELSILPPACGTAWKEIFTFPWIDPHDANDR